MRRLSRALGTSLPHLPYHLRAGRGAVGLRHGTRHAGALPRAERRRRQWSARA